MYYTDTEIIRTFLKVSMGSLTMVPVERRYTTSYNSLCSNHAISPSVSEIIGMRAAYSFEHPLNSDSVDVCGWVCVFLARRIEWTYFRLYQMQDSAARHLGRSRMTISQDSIYYETYGHVADDVTCRKW